MAVAPISNCLILRENGKSSRPDSPLTIPTSGSNPVASMNFSLADNSQYLALFAALGLMAGVNSLDFTQASNSQYLALFAGASLIAG